jgi:hypothetical protein
VNGLAASSRVGGGAVRVLYSGESGCDFETLKRLTLLAEEIGFIDYPSVKFGSWGMVGHNSWYRQIVPKPDDPVRITVHPAPGGPPSALVKRYLGPDVSDLTFRGVFLDGLREPRFSAKFIVLDGDYNVAGRRLKGQDIVDALRRDERLRDGPLELQADMGDPDLAFDVSSYEMRRRILARKLMTASVHVTSAMITAEATGAIPVSNEPYFGRLIALRAGLPSYVGGTPRITPYLGLEIMRAVIPDEALAKLEVSDTFRYRKESSDAYQAWIAEVNRIGAIIDDIDLARLHDELPRVLMTEVQPKVVAYKNELKSVRDRLFGDLVKSVFSWRLPTVSLVAVAGLNWPAAMAAFAGLGTAVLPNLVDYYVARRQARRSHAMSYVVDVTADLGSKWDEDPGVIRPQF